MARGRGFEPPTLAPSLGAPSGRCAAQLFTYSIRAGHDQWLLTGSQSGYRHPWVSNGGACVQDASRVARRNRARLGAQYDGEWFRFKIGADLDSLDCEGSGLVRGDDTCKPFMVDFRYEFEYTTAKATKPLAMPSRYPAKLNGCPSTIACMLRMGPLAQCLSTAGLIRSNHRFFNIADFSNTD